VTIIFFSGLNLLSDCVSVISLESQDLATTGTSLSAPSDLSVPPSESATSSTPTSVLPDSPSPSPSSPPEPTKRKTSKKRGGGGIGQRASLSDLVKAAREIELDSLNKIDVDVEELSTILKDIEESYSEPVCNLIFLFFQFFQN
jgi:hypothetical protein